MEVLKLKRPVLIDGEEKTEIPYDLEKLTGNDLETALQDMKRNGIQVGAIEIDPSYHMAIFAQAAGVAYEDVKRMSAKDCKNAIALVRAFSSAIRRIPPPARPPPNKGLYHHAHRYLLPGGGPASPRGAA